MMKRKELRIVTKPELSSNQHLEEEFTAEIFRRVERSKNSQTPNFIFFRHQCRPREEFDDNIAPLLIEEHHPQNTVIVSISNNSEMSDDYLDKSGFEFMLKVKLMLTEGTLDIALNEETFIKLTDFLIKTYKFRKPEEREETTDDESGFDEINKESEEKRLRLKDKQHVALLIVNDVKSEYTNSLLSALEDVDVPYVQKEMRARQFHAYKWEDIWILDLWSTDDLDLGATVLHRVSRNRKIGIILVQQQGSTTDLEKLQMRIKSKSIRKGASWHIVVAMDTAHDCSKNSSNVKAELVRNSQKNTIPTNHMHFVKNNTDEQLDRQSNLVHLIVLNDIIDCVIEQSVSRERQAQWWLRALLIFSSLIVVPATAYVLTTIYL